MIPYCSLIARWPPPTFRTPTRSVRRGTATCESTPLAAGRRKRASICNRRSKVRHLPSPAAPTVPMTHTSSKMRHHDSSRHIMKILLPLAATVGLAFLPAAAPQFPQRSSENHEIELPSGKNQQEEILKADHERDLKDATQLIELAEQLKVELEKNDRHVLSVSSLKKTDEIEKLAKRIRSRLRRF